MKNHVWALYYPKYSDTLTPYHTGPKILNNDILLPVVWRHCWMNGTHCRPRLDLESGVRSGSLLLYHACLYELIWRCFTFCQSHYFIHYNSKSTGKQGAHVSNYNSAVWSGLRRPLAESFDIAEYVDAKQRWNLTVPMHRLVWILGVRKWHNHTFYMQRTC